MHTEQMSKPLGNTVIQLFKEVLIELIGVCVENIPYIVAISMVWCFTTRSSKKMLAHRIIGCQRKCPLQTEKCFFSAAQA